MSKLPLISRKSTLNLQKQTSLSQEPIKINLSELNYQEEALQFLTNRELNKSKKFLFAKPKYIIRR